VNEQQVKRRLFERDEALIVVPCQDGEFAVLVVEREKIEAPMSSIMALATAKCPNEAAGIAMDRADGNDTSKGYQREADQARNEASTSRSAHRVATTKAAAETRKRASLIAEIEALAGRWAKRSPARSADLLDMLRKEAGKP